MGGFAWVTLATNDSYSLGALVLGHSLRKAKTAHQLAVLITPAVSQSMREQLQTVFDLVKVVDVLDSKDEANLALLKRPELGITFTKIHCWNLTEYEKCVFLDADTLVIRNCDELFEREELSAAPDVGWPDCFNTGVFVFKPSVETFDNLIKLAVERGSFDGGDQGLLNQYFSDWATEDIKKHLPFIYNLTSVAVYSYIPAFKQYGSQVRIVHFIGTAKPWLQQLDPSTKTVTAAPGSEHLTQLLQNWWDIFCEKVQPELAKNLTGIAGAIAQLSLDPSKQDSAAASSAQEEYLRRQNWESGNVDYLGRDSFDNIWSKICETIDKKVPEDSENSALQSDTNPSSDDLNPENFVSTASIQFPKTQDEPGRDAKTFQSIIYSDQNSYPGLVSLSMILNDRPSEVEYMETLPSDNVPYSIGDDDDVIFLKSGETHHYLTDIIEEEPAVVETESEGTGIREKTIAEELGEGFVVGEPDSLPDVDEVKETEVQEVAGKTEIDGISSRAVSSILGSEGIASTPSLNPDRTDGSSGTVLGADLGESPLASDPVIPSESIGVVNPEPINTQDRISPSVPESAPSNPGNPAPAGTTQEVTNPENPVEAQSGNASRPASPPTNPDNPAPETVREITNPQNLEAQSSSNLLTQPDNESSESTPSNPGNPVPAESALGITNPENPVEAQSENAPRPASPPNPDNPAPATIQEIANPQNLEDQPSLNPGTTEEPSNPSGPVDSVPTAATSDLSVPANSEISATPPSEPNPSEPAIRPDAVVVIPLNPLESPNGPTNPSSSRPNNPGESSNPPENPKSNENQEGKQKKGVISKILEFVGVSPKPRKSKDETAETSKSKFYDTEEEKPSDTAKKLKSAEVSKSTFYDTEDEKPPENLQVVPEDISKGRASPLPPLAPALFETSFVSVCAIKPEEADLVGKETIDEILKATDLSSLSDEVPREEAAEVPKTVQSQSEVLVKEVSEVAQPQLEEAVAVKEVPETVQSQSEEVLGVRDVPETVQLQPEEAAIAKKVPETVQSQSEEVLAVKEVPETLLEPRKSDSKTNEAVSASEGIPASSSEPVAINSEKVTETNRPEDVILVGASDNAETELLASNKETELSLEPIQKIETEKKELKNEPEEAITGPAHRDHAEEAVVQAAPEVQETESPEPTEIRKSCPENIKTISETESGPVKPEKAIAEEIAPETAEEPPAQNSEPTHEAKSEPLSISNLIGDSFNALSQLGSELSDAETLEMTKVVAETFGKIISVLEDAAGEAEASEVKKRSPSPRLAIIQEPVPETTVTSPTPPTSPEYKGPVRKEVRMLSVEETIPETPPVPDGEKKTPIFLEDNVIVNLEEVSFETESLLSEIEDIIEEAKSYVQSQLPMECLQDKQEKSCERDEEKRRVVQNEGEKIVQEGAIEIQPEGENELQPEDTAAAQLKFSLAVQEEPKSSQVRCETTQECMLELAEVSLEKQKEQTTVVQSEASENVPEKVPEEEADDEFFEVPNDKLIVSGTLVIDALGKNLEKPAESEPEPLPKKPPSLVENKQPLPQEPEVQLEEEEEPVYSNVQKIDSKLVPMPETGQFEVEEIKVTSDEERRKHKSQPSSSKLSDQILKAIPPPRRKAISESKTAVKSPGAIPKAKPQVSNIDVALDKPIEESVDDGVSSPPPVPPRRNRSKTRQPPLPPPKRKTKK